MKHFTLYFLLFSSIVSVKAATIFSADSSGATVQSTINSATYGDTVIISNNVATTNSITATIAVTNNLYILFTNVWWQENVTDTGNDNTRAVIRLDTTTNINPTIDGLHIIKGSGGHAYTDAGCIRVTGTGRAIKILNCTISSPDNIGFGIWGGFGVVYKCSWNNAGGFRFPMKIGNGNTLGGSFGNWVWASNYTTFAGTTNAFYFDNCTWTNSNGSSGITLDCQSGGIYVCRSNYFDRIVAGGHGTETTGSERGSRWKELYWNTFDEHGDSEAIHFRSGGGVVFSNTIKNVFSPITLRVYRMTSTANPWGFANGTNAWDINDSTIYDSGTATAVTVTSTNSSLSDSEKSWTVNQWKDNYTLRDINTGHASVIASNTATTLYVYIDNTIDFGMTITVGDSYQIRKIINIIDTPGRGQGNLLTGSASPVGYPSNAVETIYQWTNTYSSVTSPNIGKGIYYVLAEGREYSNNVAMPNYTPLVYPHPLIQTPDPFITGQPDNQTVTAPATATFTVTASGTAPLTYQWYKNGSLISGATVSSYTTPSTTYPTDNGNTYYCIVGSGVPNSQQSSTATLTVNSAGSSFIPTITTINAINGNVGTINISPF